jgi:hypothetical protein
MSKTIGRLTFYQGAAGCGWIITPEGDEGNPIFHVDVGDDFEDDAWGLVWSLVACWNSMMDSPGGERHPVLEVRDGR